MKARFPVIAVAIFLLISCLSCSKKSAIDLNALDAKKSGIRLVAVMPVECKIGDPLPARFLREILLNEVSLKGYPKIRLVQIDERLRRISELNRNLAPQQIAEALGVDAVLYSSIDEWNSSYKLIYASTTVSAKFELRNAKTGEVLWGYKNAVITRNFGFRNKQLELKCAQNYEPALLEIVEKSMKSFPEGPEYLGQAPSSGRALKEWF